MARFALTLLLLTACGARGHRQTGGPASALKPWIDATEADDAQAAYRLLSKETQAQIQFASFRKRWDDSKRERKEQAKSMQAAMQDHTAIEQRALIGRSTADRAHLVHEKEGWRLDAPLLSSARALTPLDALAHLRKAMRELSVGQLLRIMSSATRARVDNLIKNFRAGLEGNESAEVVQVSGHTAFLKWTDDDGVWEIKLILENGEWRVDDVFPPR